ncbi:MAG: DUF2256 domain-containing protein [Pseudoxanthomonas sp.]|nr:DUF2256 domain-containing protein [Pseudoxanthomonas sp.]
MTPAERPRRRGQGDARALPEKPCAVCGRPMAWRRRWARCWDQVKYCSDACRKGTPRGR